ncbi:D-beta-hydroxybutyrate dehydrogenase-like [Bradysia coprophila]|uniref:D-beta-hydroxybutyrate dehydrogenase-like n=1 Tax=Bradysia coprophila TaxID=38358 RepID=UPI00187D7C1B|nr:D-beta-hydroxybutyrate dehydrogenase-like [Bradysia coprophila]XP_037045276.1 D-beta-hydroxybutyrate dehydrogenase-like [Bradysia coprophila]
MSSLKSLRGKCAVVTGSTSGIGWGVVTQFAKAGCRIMLHGLEKESEISNLKEELANLSHDKVAYSSADLVDPEQCKGLISEATSQLGKVDILVNNAGVQFTAPVHEFPPEKWNWLISINLNAPYHLTRSVIPQMYDRKWGRLIHIASAHGKVASPNKSGYCASKHGVLGFSKSVALESAGTGVTSNCICPGWVLTPLVQKQIEKISKERQISLHDAKMQLLLEKQPSGEFVKPEDLGDFAVFLSTDAASQITGASLSMDGGWTAR